MQITVSEYVLSEPMDKEWIRRCTAELAPRLAPGGDALAYVIDAPDGSMAACALGLIRRVLPAPPSPGGWQAACTWSPHTRMPGAAATPEPCPRAARRAPHQARETQLLRDMTLVTAEQAPRCCCAVRKSQRGATRRLSLPVGGWLRLRGRKSSNLDIHRGIDADSQRCVAGRQSPPAAV